MSARKMFASLAAMVAVLAVTERPGAIGLDSQAQVRDLRPGEARPASRRELELEASLATAPPTVGLYQEIAKLQEDRGARSEAEATFLRGRAALPRATALVTGLAYFYNRNGQFDLAVAALEDAAAMSPSDAAGFYLIATFYQQRVQGGRDLDPATRLGYIHAGIGATDRAFLLVPEHIDAMMVRSALLRQEAMTQTDPTTRGRLTAQADQMQGRALELRAKRTLVSGNGSPVMVSGVVGSVQTGVPGEVRSQLGSQPDPTQSGYPAPTAPIRVGGNIKTPAKTLDARPVYPAEAQANRVQGVVIIELTIDPAGAVADAKVLRSIPMLDQAAIDAVRQWQFTPTMLNGAPVPVIMTVTVNFTLQD